MIQRILIHSACFRKTGSGGTTWWAPWFETAPREMAGLIIFNSSFIWHASVLSTMPGCLELRRYEYCHWGPLQASTNLCKPSKIGVHHWHYHTYCRWFEQLPMVLRTVAVEDFAEHLTLLRRANQLLPSLNRTERSRGTLMGTYKIYW